MAEVDSLALITDRLIEIVGDIDDIALASNEYPAELHAGNLPFAFIEEPGEASYQKISAHTLSSTREWFMLFYVQQFAQGNESDETLARAEARRLVRKVARELFKRVQLQYDGDNGVGDAFVYHAEINRDYSVESASRKGNLYSAFAYRYTVTELDDLSED